jgi:hypothetical protein
MEVHLMAKPSVSDSFIRIKKHLEERPMIKINEYEK